MCKKDAGGPHTFRNKWTTFVKARLNCSVPGQYPFYFNQIQSLSPLVKSMSGDDLVFAVLNTPENSIVGSAVCSFSMTDIRDSFNSQFKVQQDVNSNWLALPQDREPSTRPGQCHVNSKQLDDEHLNFLKENILMDKAVPGSTHHPHYVKTSPHERLTAIAVDAAIKTTDGDLVDVLYVGTTRGRVLKLVSHKQTTTLIEEIQIFPLHVPVSNILVTQHSGGVSGRVVVLSQHQVKSFPKSRCDTTNIVTCRECVGVQDPYCSWSVRQQKCVTTGSSDEDTSSLLQNIGTGHHTGCPNILGDMFLQSAKMTQFDQNIVKYTPIQYSDIQMAPERFYSEKTTALACASAAFLALLIGFLSGFCFSRKYQSDQNYLKCGHSYLESNGVKW